MEEISDDEPSKDLEVKAAAPKALEPQVEAVPEQVKAAAPKALEPQVEAVPKQALQPEVGAPEAVIPVLPGSFEEALAIEMEEELNKLDSQDKINVPEGVNKILAAEAADLPEALPEPTEDLRKQQLAMKADNKEKQEQKKKDQEMAREAKAAAKAKAKQDRLDKKEAKKKEEEEKKAKKASKKTAKEAAPPAEEQPAVDEVLEQQAEDEEVDDMLEDVNKEVKKAKAKVKAQAKKKAGSEPAGSSAEPAAKAKGRPRKGYDGADGEVKEAPVKKARKSRSGNSTVVDKVMVENALGFIAEWKGTIYDKAKHSLHKGTAGLTPYWSRDACGLKLPKKDENGAVNGKWQACYFQVKLENDVVCPMALNLYLCKMFADKCVAGGDGWAEKAEAGEFYGLLVRSFRAAAAKLK